MRKVGLHVSLRCCCADLLAVEDPFSVLSFFVPDPPSRPLLTPLYPTLPPSDLTQPFLPAPVNVPPTPILPSLSSSSSTKSTNGRCKTKRQHWAIIRNAPGRGRVRDKDDDDYVPLWKVPREASATDYGAFGTLVGLLAKERGVRDVGAGLGSEERLHNTIRNSLDETTEPTNHRLETDIKDVEMQGVDQQYWKGKDRVAEEYVRDIVYGGVDGLAYVRSLAEFVDRSAPLVSVRSALFIPDAHRKAAYRRTVASLPRLVFHWRAGSNSSLLIRLLTGDIVF